MGERDRDKRAMAITAAGAPGAAGRLGELDSLRGLAALGVVLWHYSGMLGSQPLAGPLRPLYLSGGLLVDFFFVLSGFVLARSFDTAARRGQFARNVWARVARMYPLHVVTLLVVLACDGVNAWHGHPPSQYNDPYHFGLNLLLLQSSGLQRNYSFNGPSWSISAEFLINLLFLALIAHGGRVGRWFMAILAVICAGILLHSGILNHGAPVSGQLGGWLDLSLVRCWFGFFVGTQCQRLLQAHGRVVMDGKGLRGTVGAGLAGDLLGAAALVMILAYMARGLPQSHLGDVLLAALGFPALILGSIHGRLLRKLLRWRPFQWLGEISYSIYLVHFPLIVGLLLIAGFSGPLPTNHVASLLAFYALVLGTATLSYRYIELPGKRWLSSWWPRRAGMPAAASPAAMRRRAEPPSAMQPVLRRDERDSAYP